MNRARVVCLVALLALARHEGAKAQPASDPLAALGIDRSLWQGVENRRPLEAEDRRAFYELLLAVGRVTPATLIAQAASNTPVAPLFNEPDQQFGRLVRLEGVVRRVTRVRIDDPELRRQYGLDHYFQVELFPHDSQNNPIVCCLRTVPGGEGGAKLHETWIVAGFFFKVWAYRSQAAAGEGPKTRLAPLVIGPGAVRVVTEPPDDRASNVVALAFLGLAVVVALALALIWRRGDRAAREQLRRLRRGDLAPPKARGDAT